MIRLLAGGIVIAIVALALYLPATVPPERFLEQIRIEHSLNLSAWGSRHAIDVLDRALAWRSLLGSGPLRSANAEPPPARTAADAALAREITSTSRRLVGNVYFASIEAMGAMALYRLAALYANVGLVLVFGVAAFVDALLRRAIKSKQFELHHPEVFGACGVLILLSLLATTLAFLVPTTLHPYFVATIPLVLIALGALALANFHHRA